MSESLVCDWIQHHTLAFSLIASLILSASYSSTIMAQETSLTSSKTDSSSVSTANGERLLPDIRQQQLLQLSKVQSPNTDVVWLETQQESFLGLYQAANAANAQGGVILLHHNRTSPDWPSLIRDLRKGLPNQGWHTLSIALPDEPMVAIPKRSEDEETSPSNTSPTKDTTPTTDYTAFANQINDRIESAINYLANKDLSRYILIGVGTGGYWAGYYLTNVANTKTIHLVLLDVESPKITMEPAIDKLIAALKIPTADLYHSRLLNQSAFQISAKDRLNETRRQKRENYLQRRLAITPTAGNQLNQRLLNTFKGILEKRLLNMEKQGPNDDDEMGAKMATERPPG